MRKVLITGANGFVGSALSHWLAKADWSVSALVRPNADYRLLDLRGPHDSVDVVETDYSDKTSLARLCEGVDAIVHCAARTRAFNESDYRKANIDLTRDLVETLNTASPDARFVFVSSLAAAGDASSGAPRTEDEPEEPVSQYGRSKLEAEQTVRDTARRWTTVRPASVYGPGDSDFLFMFQAVKRRVLPVSGKRGRRLSLIHVDDLCRHIELCLDTPAAEGEVFFATDSPPPTLTEFILALELAVGAVAVQIPIHPKLAMGAAAGSEMIGRLRGEVPLLNRERALEFTGGDWTCSPEKSHKLLGFAPQRNLRKALEETAAWYRKHGWL